MTRLLYPAFFFIVAALWVLPCVAQTQPDASPPDIPTLIQQLGDPKVRLRDAAEAKLRQLPDAAEALEAAAGDHPSEEARLRARKILNSAIRNRWHLAASLANGHLSGYPRAPLRICVSADRKVFLTQGQDSAVLWDATQFNPIQRFGKPNGTLSNWEGEGPLRGFALSPDGKTAVTSDDFGVLHATDTDTGKLRQSWNCFASEFPPDALPSILVIWSALFTPDGRYLTAGGWHGNLVVHDARTLKRVTSLKLCDNILTFQFVTPDSRWLLAIEDTPGAVDYIYVVDTSTWQVVDTRAIRDLIYSLAFFADGKRFIASGRYGHIAIWDFDPETGKIGDETAWGNYGGNISGIVFGHDQKSLVVASSSQGKQLCEYDIETKKILWSEISTPQIDAITPLGTDGFITSGRDHQIRIWRRTPAGASSPPPPLVRTLSDRFDPANTYTLKYEADPHDVRPSLLDALIYLPESELLVTRGHDKIVVSSAEDLSTIRSFGPKVTRLPGYLSRTTCGAIAVTKDEQTVIAADDDGVIGFYDIETGKLTRSFPTLATGASQTLSVGERSTLEIVPDHEEKILYITDSQSRLGAWELATGKLLAETRLPAPGATVQLAPDGSLLMIRTLDSQAQCLQLLVSTDGLMLLDGSGDSKEACYGRGDFIDEGSSFLRPNNDGQLLRFTPGRKGLGKPEVQLRMPGIMYQATVSDDGEKLVCAGGGGVPLSVWDINEMRLLWTADSASGGLFRALPLGTDRIVTVGLEHNKLQLYRCQPNPSNPEP